MTDPVLENVRRGRCSRRQHPSVRMMRPTGPRRAPDLDARQSLAFERDRGRTDAL